MTSSTILNRSFLAKEPILEVGILQSHELSIVFKKPYQLVYEDSSLSAPFTGPFTLTVSAGKILFNELLFDQLLFIPVHPSEASFGMNNVRIGIHFHWEVLKANTLKGHLNVSFQKDNSLPSINYLSKTIL
jgi:hypothetical protein